LLEGPAPLFEERKVVLALMLAQAESPASSLPTIAFMVGSFFIIFYFLVMRPQAKQQNEQKAFLDKLSKGDEVIAAGGIVAKVDKVVGDIVHVEVSNNVKLRVLKAQIAPYKPAPEKIAEVEKPAPAAEDKK
jgi:preprotein translocase subunit YajC